jgi:hypothetical protein
MLIDELEAFGMDVTPSGHLIFSAPEGYHDDCVMSLAMAYWHIKGKTKTENMVAAQSIPQRKKRFQYK